MSARTSRLGVVTPDPRLTVVRIIADPSCVVRVGSQSLHDASATAVLGEARTVGDIGGGCAFKETVGIAVTELAAETNVGQIFSRTRTRA